MNKSRLLVLAAVMLLSCSNGSGPSQSSPQEASSEPEASSAGRSTTSEADDSSDSEEASASESASSAEEASSDESMASSEEGVSEESSTAESSQSKQELDPMTEPLIGRQYYLNHIGDIYTAWQHYRGRGITIAVIDVGFAPHHPDFTYADGTSKVSAKSASFTTDKSGKTTVVEGVDACENLGESHGTFCAGVAAAGANGFGVVGVAPEAELMLLKTDCKPKSIVKAFDHAKEKGAKVITISIGSYYDYTGDLVNDGSDLGTVFDRCIADCYNAGIAVVSAGGNGGLDGMPTEFTFPGCVDNVIGVGGLAANKSTEIWEGSSYNSSPEWQSIDVFAPADYMFGCCNYGGKDHDGGMEDGRGKWRGTSFASPIVAGMAALYFEAFPEKGASDFESDLYKSCHQITTSAIASKNQLGHGRVDVGKLLGLTPMQSVQAKHKANWSTGYAYCFDSVTGVQNAPWPGVAMSKSNGLFTITINPGTYDSVVFTASKDGPQSVDVLSTSFLADTTFDLTSNYKENGVLVGAYK